jgi:hypothetical protein
MSNNCTDKARLDSLLVQQRGELRQLVVSLIVDLLIDMLIIGGAVLCLLLMRS